MFRLLWLTTIHASTTSTIHPVNDLNGAVGNDMLTFSSSHLLLECGHCTFLQPTKINNYYFPSTLTLYKKGYIHRKTTNFHKTNRISSPKKQLQTTNYKLLISRIWLIIGIRVLFFLSTNFANFSNWHPRSFFLSTNFTNYSNEHPRSCFGPRKRGEIEQKFYLKI
jgi:hypothetical protein